MLVLGLIVGTTLVYLTQLVWNILRNYKEHQHIPMPPQDGWLVGHLVTITKHRFDQTLIQAIGKYTKQCGEVFHIRLMTHCLIVVLDPIILKEILNDLDNFPKNNSVINRRFGKQKVLGEHSFLSSQGGDVWHHKRQSMAKFLNHLNIRKYFENIKSATEQLLLEVQDKANGQEILDLNDISGGVVTSIIGQLGLDNGIEMVSPNNKEIASAIHVMMTEMNTAFFTPFYHSTPGIWEKHKKLVLEKITFLRSTCADILRIRREQMKLGIAADEDIIAHIVKMNDSQFPGQDEFIVDDIMTVFLASENTPRTIVMCLAFLVRNPHQLGKLLFEIDTVLKDKRVPDIDDLDRLKYTEMTILETLRLYPAVSRNTRVSKQEKTINNVTFPAGSRTVTFYELLHKNEKYWKDPEEFRPLRFAETKNRVPYTYLSFLAGPRSCLGKPLAIMQMKTILASLLRHFKFAYLPGEEEIKVMQSYVLLKLSQGFRCTAVPRDHTRFRSKTSSRLSGLKGTILSNIPDVTRVFDPPVLP
ncbi:hypothetical protein ACHWQZ_G016761 [Mnemiopsis leidyi]